MSENLQNNKKSVHQASKSEMLILPNLKLKEHLQTVIEAKESKVLLGKQFRAKEARKTLIIKSTNSSVSEKGAPYLAQNIRRHSPH